MNYADMTIENLLLKSQELREHGEAIREERRQLAAVLDEKLRKREVLRKIADLSDDEKQILAQHLGTEHIPSGEQVHGMGQVEVNT